MEWQCKFSSSNLVFSLTLSFIARNQGLKRRYRVTPGSWSNDARRMGTIRYGDCHYCQGIISRPPLLMCWSCTSPYHYHGFNCCPATDPTPQKQPFTYIYACICPPPMRNTESHVSTYFALQSFKPCPRTTEPAFLYPANTKLRHEHQNHSPNQSPSHPPKSPRDSPLTDPSYLAHCNVISVCVSIYRPMYPIEDCRGMIYRCNLDRALSSPPKACPVSHVSGLWSSYFVHFMHVLVAQT